MKQLCGSVICVEVNNEKENGRDPVKILCVTANALIGDSENYLAAGMDDYLSKPYRQEEFERKIFNLLGQNHLIIENAINHID